MSFIKEVIDFLVLNKEAILVGASAVVIIDFAVRALKSGAAMTSSVLVFILNMVWVVILKPVLLLLLWLLEQIINLVSWVQEKRRAKLKPANKAVVKE